MAARTAWRGWAAGWLCGLGLLAVAQAQDQGHAQTSQPAEIYARLQREREALAQEQRQAELACYQRFAVEDCLAGADVVRFAPSYVVSTAQLDEAADVLGKVLPEGVAGKGA